MHSCWLNTNISYTKLDTAYKSCRGVKESHIEKEKYDVTTSQDTNLDLQRHRQTSCGQICIHLNPVSTGCNSNLKTSIFALCRQST
jgi:hypothetical protein